MVKHPNAKTVWTTVRVDRQNTLEKILMVETDLATTSLEPGFDELKFKELVDAIIDTMKQNPAIDRAEISRIRKH